MESVEILYWGLSSLFSLAMAFAILVWCRSWRKEERQERDRQIQALQASVNRLMGALELMDQTAASMQAADEKLTRFIDLQERPTPQPAAAQPQQADPPPQPDSEPSRTSSPDGQDVYERAKRLVQAGSTPAQVARELDLGVAEVQMIARVLNEKAPA